MERQTDRSYGIRWRETEHGIGLGGAEQNEGRKGIWNV